MTSPEGTHGIDGPTESLEAASSWSDHVNHTHDRVRRNTAPKPPRVEREVQAGSRIGALLSGLGEVLEEVIDAAGSVFDD